MAEQALEELFSQTIPTARQALKNSHKSLDELANYCEKDYVQASNPKTSVESTKQYAAQSLASVAYQINTLANGILMLLDKQSAKLGEMEANVHHINMVRVDIDFDFKVKIIVIQFRVYLMLFN